MRAAVAAARGRGGGVLRITAALPPGPSAQRAGSGPQRWLWRSAGHGVALSLFLGPEAPERYEQRIALEGTAEVPTR